MLKNISNDSLLTLAIPVGLEEDVLDFLLLHPLWATGFSVLAAQGMGQGAVLQSPMELVQGLAIIFCCCSRPWLARFRAPR